MSVGRALPITLLLASGGARAAADPADFTSDARLIYRVAACAGSDPLPAAVDVRALKDHCQEVNDEIADYRRGWIDRAAPFIAKSAPPASPTRSSIRSAART